MLFKCPYCEKETEYRRVSATSGMPIEYGYIIRSKNLQATLENGSEKVLVNLNNPKEIMQKTFGNAGPEIGQSQYVKGLIFKKNAKSLSGQEQTYDVSVLPISIEFDYGNLEFQAERIAEMAHIIQTPMYSVESGNKSIHWTTWWKPFATNADEYRLACFKFYKWLSENHPDYFFYHPRAMNKPEDKLELIPDISMFSGNSRYTRQAFGRHANGNIQRGTIFHSSNTPLADLSNFQIDVEEI